ncbi:adenylate kinase [Candidatus Dependentiae bacterium]|nr:adenylate kinase [Candidatus Dependentiae bacterium]
MNKIIGYIIFTIVVVSTIFLYTKYYKANDMKQEKVIFTFFGAPGCGKGTLAEQAVNKLGFQVISTGDLCRKNIAEQTEVGKEIEKIIKAGKLVPDELITGMLTDWIKQNADPDKPLILDGFPRTKGQARIFAQYLKENMPEYKFRIIKIDLSEEEIVSRLAGRRVCENKACQAVYHISMPEVQDGICKKCGSKLISRADDKEEVVRERLNVYNKNEKELLDFYKSNGFEIETLNIAGLSRKQVFEKFKSIL